MLRKFFNKYYYKRYYFIFLILIFSIFYLYLFNKYDNFKDILYNKKTSDSISSKLLYSSLNRVVNYSDMIITSYENDNIKKVSKIINEDKTIEPKKDPIIYIYNTHDTESYTLPFISDYSITPTVKIASYILKDYLNDLKIESVVENRKIKTYLNKNNLDYSYSYQASRSYIKDELKKYNYKILIDLHRDSATKKYTSYEKDGKKYARIMFVLGQNHSNYKENEKFMNNLNDRINKKYKGLSRGVFIRKSSKYNQDLSKYAILIEVGGVDSTLEEINNTLYVFANILNDYINEEIYGRK